MYNTVIQHEHSFEHGAFQMPVRHPSGKMKEPVARVESQGKAEGESIKLGISNVRTDLKLWDWVGFHGE